VWSEYDNNDWDDKDDGIYLLQADNLHGEITINPDGTFSYTPDPNFSGQASFEYMVDDGNNGIDTATVTIDVTTENGIPTANDLTAAVNEDDILSDNVSGSDPDDDDLSYTVDTGTSHGILDLNADGSYDYTPDADFNGQDSFSYVADDGQDDSAPATVDITINPVNDAPLADGPDSFTIDEDAFLSDTLTATDVDLDDLTFSLLESDVNPILLPDSDYGLWPQINTHGQIVWSGNDDDNDGNDKQLFFFDGSSTIQLTVDNYDDFSHQINDNGQVIWTYDDHPGPGTTTIFLYDGNYDPITLVDNAEGNAFLNNNGQVAYTGFDGDREIFLYDNFTSTQFTFNDYDDFINDINDSASIVRPGCLGGWRRYRK